MLAAARPQLLQLEAERRIRLACAAKLSKWVATAHDKQRAFFASTARFRAFSGGIGSGKTWSGCVEALRQPHGSVGMVVAPTYPMLRDATVRTFLALAERCHALTGFNVAEMRATLRGDVTVLFRSADNPERLRGPNLGWAYLDEAALCEALTWPILIGRLREQPGRAWVTTTPRGFNWVHSEFAEEREGHDLIRCATWDNPFLPAEYVESVRKSYTGAWAAQELAGEFIDTRGAGLFATERIEIIDAAPGGLERVRAWDKAATAGAGDWTAGALMGGPDEAGRYYVLDVVRAQLEPAGVDALMRQAASADGIDVGIRLPQDPGQAGKVDAQAMLRMLAGYSVRAEAVTGDKATRARPFASQCNAGNVKLVRAPWNKAFLDELRAFPNPSVNDDQVDAASDAFNSLSRDRRQILWVA